MVDAGSEPTYEEKMRVPGSPLGTLLQILILPVTRNIPKNRLHCVTYLPAKLEDVISNAFKRKFIIWTLALPLATGNIAQCPLHYVIYANAKVLSDCVRSWVYKKILLYLWSFQGHIKCSSLPFTSCDLGICSLKVLRQSFKEVMHLQETWWTDVCTHKWGRWTTLMQK